MGAYIGAPKKTYEPRILYSDSKAPGCQKSLFVGCLCLLGCRLAGCLEFVTLWVSMVFLDLGQKVSFLEGSKRQLKFLAPIHTPGSYNRYSWTRARVLHKNLRHSSGLRRPFSMTTVREQQCHPGRHYLSGAS